MAEGARLALKVLVAAVLLGLLLWMAEPARLAETLRGADPWSLALAFVFYAAMTLGETDRVQAAFASYGLKFGAAMRLNLVSTFLGNFSPGMLGADAYKIWFLSRLEKGLTRPLALTVVLRFLGTVTLLALAGIAVLAEPGPRAALREVRWKEVPAETFGPALAGVALLLGLAALAVLWRWRHALAERARTARAALALLRPAQLARITAVSLGVSIFRSLSLQYAVRSFAGDVSTGEAAVVAALSLILGSLPVSVGGLGVTEGATAGALVLLGVPQPAAVAAALVNRAFVWLVSAAGAVLFLRSRTARA